MCHAVISHFDHIRAMFFNFFSIQELIRSACGGLVNLLLEDHHHEAWRAPPAPKVKPFSGTGTMLGHPTPRLVPSSTTTTTTPRPPVEQPVSLPGPSVDESKPVTQVQVRMPDGGRYESSLG
ncbi:unnamed protein product [Echinostoma caproni]|uniref:UBX domain-containing protein n=1 Tax=Echinostoma caproni TaxID=27848 RepID=A0A183AZZ9_9TREM|nr:unnamed protein product [Echinostoma caproni]